MLFFFLFSFFTYLLISVSSIIVDFSDISFDDGVLSIEC